MIQFVADLVGIKEKNKSRWWRLGTLSKETISQQTGLAEKEIKTEMHMVGRGEVVKKE